MKVAVKHIILFCEKFKGDPHVLKHRIVKLERINVNYIIVLHILPILFVHLLLLIEFSQGRTHHLPLSLCLGIDDRTTSIEIFFPDLIDLKSFGSCFNESFLLHLANHLPVQLLTEIGWLFTAGLVLFILAP